MDIHGAFRTARAWRWAAAGAVVAVFLVESLGTARADARRQPTADELAGWPVDVKGFTPVQPGEHPRLLFRKSDIAELRRRAKTAEGQGIIKRLRVQLNGGDGESMPTRYGVKGRVGRDGAGAFAKDPPGTYTFSHTAGFGFLYVLTGEKKYADLARQCMDKAFEGQRDRDRRYSFKAPYGALRCGPSLGWTALGYDLCHDAWDADYRQKVARAIQNYNEGRWMSLAELTRGARQHPGSNHWGMQVGGAAMALLAVMNDPGVDMKKIAPLLETSQKSMIVNMTQGFGDGGFFAEGDGTGSMSSHIVFLSALQAWKTAAGKDFISPRPNAQWMALKWIFLTVPRRGKLDFPTRGAYGHNVWARTDKSGAGYFSIGFGAVKGDQRAAMLWFYNRHLKAADDKNAAPCDTPTPYPHHAICALVNWPFGAGELNPGEVLPHAYRDTKWGFYAWRNGWRDENDIVLSILTRRAKGNYSAKAENTLTIQAGGKRLRWGRINGGFKGEYKPAPDGSTVLATGDGSCLAVDFSGACGAEGMLVMTGPGAPASGTVVEAGGRKFSFLFLTRKTPPQPNVTADKIAVGEQTVSFDGKRIVLAR